MKVNPLKDFDLGDQSFKTGQSTDINEQDARGLAAVGYVEIVDADDTKSQTAE
jgi:hypothetical protein